MFTDAVGRARAHIDLVEQGYGAALHVAVDPYDDSIWLATDLGSLLHFSTSGALIAGTPLPGGVDALVIALDQTPWLVSHGAVVHLSTSATVLGTFATPLTSNDGPPSLAIDSLRDQLWLANARGVWRIPFEGDGRPIDSTVVVDEPYGITLDQRSGELWVLTSDGLTVVDPLGVRQLSIELPASAQIDSAVLDYDNADQVVIVRSRTGVFRAARDGHIEDDAPPDAGAPLVIPAPFAIAPTIAMLRPPAGGATTEPVPAMTLQLGAQCNAAHCMPPRPYVESIRFDAQVDGDAVSSRSEHAATGRFIIAPAAPLAAGAHRITARASDRFKRNASLDATISIVDRNLNRGTASELPVPGALPAQVNAPVTKAANKVPTVVLTSPANGATYTVGATIALAANATDADGTVAKVEFYRNGSTLIGTDTSPPYQLNWTNVAAGSYTLSAKVYDNRNGTATSAIVSITILANKPPAITLTQPVIGAFYGEGSAIGLAASASDADGVVARVEFLDGTTVVGVSNAAPFAVTWNGATAGDHLIAARAIDDKGGTTTSTPVSIHIGQQPLVVVRQPIACSVLDGSASLVLSADAISTEGSISSVRFFDNGAFAGVAFAEPWTITLSQPTPGAHTLTAWATDDRGLEAQSRAVMVTVGAANQPPSVTITSPVEGSRFASGAAVNLNAAASDADGTVVGVDYRLNDANGVLVGRSTSAPFSAVWASAAAGSYTLVAVASDDRGAKTTSSPVHVTIDANVPPFVSIIAPAPNRVYQAPATVVLSASATDSDGSIAKVDYFAGTTPVGSANTAPYSAMWSNVAAGTYVLTARATDNRGATSTSLPVPIAVTSNAPPSVTLYPLVDEHYFAPATLELSADASDADGAVASVEFRANGNIIGVATSAPYRYVWSNVGTGSYSVTATAVDDRGAPTTSAPMIVSVGGALSVVVNPDLPGAMVADDNVLVRGVVSAPLNSAMTINGVVTHVDDFGQFQANDIPLAPGANTVTAVVTTQDGQTATHTLVINSTGRGALITHASPTEGLNSLAVRFTVENPDDVPFGRITFDLDNDGTVDITATPAQFVDGALTVAANYPTGTWIAVITAYDDRGNVIYSTHKSIVVLSPAALQAKVTSIYNGMIGRLRAGNVVGALTALTSSARERYGSVLSEMQATLPSIVSQLGDLQEINFGIDLAELSVVRATQTGAEQFMLYMLRSEDGIWRFDGM